MKCFLTSCEEKQTNRKAGNSAMQRYNRGVNMPQKPDFFTVNVKAVITVQKPSACR